MILPDSLIAKRDQLYYVKDVEVNSKKYFDYESWFISIIAKTAKINLGSEGMQLMVRHHTLHLPATLNPLFYACFFNEFGI